MRVGDLVRTSRVVRPMLTGIIFKVDHEFYGHTARLMSGGRMKRLHIVWSNEEITADPETYVEVINQERDIDLRVQVQEV
jgi:hypothetical protein